MHQLLNFLISGEPREALYTVLGRTMALHAPLIKLCDFGSAVVAPEQNAFIEELSTVENTPLDWFWRTAASAESSSLPTHGPSADIWGLGLCMVHLLTGEKPYEEHLEHVRCPLALRELLANSWCAGGSGSGSGKFGAVSATAEEGDEHVELMSTTVYRVRLNVLDYRLLYDFKITTIY